MKRLIDLAPEHRLLQRAHELIRATGPTPLVEARMRQVRRRLDEPGVRAPRGGWLRAASALALLGTGASALALGGTFDHSPPPAAPPGLTAPATMTAPVVPRPAQSHVGTPTPASTPSASAARPTAAPASRRPAPAPASASDVRRVHEAARVLRGEGNAERAQRILEAGGEVSGPLAEEALALRIEAARASGDSRAAALARSYLARYPAGRYRELAERTLVERK